MIDLVEQVARALSDAGLDDVTSDDARAAIIAVFDWMAEPSQQALSDGMDVAENCMDEDYSSNGDGDREYYTTLRSDAPFRVYRAMLTQLRKEAGIE